MVSQGRPAGPPRRPQYNVAMMYHFWMLGSGILGQVDMVPRPACRSGHVTGTVESYQILPVRKWHASRSSGCF